MVWCVVSNKDTKFQQEREVEEEVGELQLLLSSLVCPISPSVLGSLVGLFVLPRNSFESAP